MVEGAQDSPSSVLYLPLPPKQQHVRAEIKVPRTCMVVGCRTDLSKDGKYHQRHGVCREHLRASSVCIGGDFFRFCQQCGRFHTLDKFKGATRSCKKSLQRHASRRKAGSKRGGCRRRSEPTSFASSPLHGNSSAPSNCQHSGLVDVVNAQVRAADSCTSAPRTSHTSASTPSSSFMDTAGCRSPVACSDSKGFVHAASHGTCSTLKAASATPHSQVTHTPSRDGDTVECVGGDRAAVVPIGDWHPGTYTGENLVPVCKKPGDSWEAFVAHAVQEHAMSLESLCQPVVEPSDFGHGMACTTVCSLRDEMHSGLNLTGSSISASTQAHMEVPSGYGGYLTSESGGFSTGAVPTGRGGMEGLLPGLPQVNLSHISMPTCHGTLYDTDTALFSGHQDQLKYGHALSFGTYFAGHQGVAQCLPPGVCTFTDLSAATSMQHMGRGASPAGQRAGPFAPVPPQLPVGVRAGGHTRAFPPRPQAEPLQYFQQNFTPVASVHSSYLAPQGFWDCDDVHLAASEAQVKLKRVDTMDSVEDPLELLLRDLEQPSAAPHAMATEPCVTGWL